MFIEGKDSRYKKHDLNEAIANIFTKSACNPDVSLCLIAFEQGMELVSPKLRMTPVDSYSFLFFWLCWSQTTVSLWAVLCLTDTDVKLIRSSKMIHQHQKQPWTMMAPLKNFFKSRENFYCTTLSSQDTTIDGKIRKEKIFHRRMEWKKRNAGFGIIRLHRDI